MGEAVDLSASAPGAGRGDEAVAGATAGSLSARHGARLSIDAVVRLRCDGRRGIHTGFVRDLSRGGMFLRLVDPEPAGRRLGFDLWLPGKRWPARGVGEVAWQRPDYGGPGRPAGMALRFVALEAAAIAMLAELLPDGEVPEVEVLPPPRLPSAALAPTRDEATAIAPAAGPYRAAVLPASTPAGEAPEAAHQPWLPLAASELLIAEAFSEPMIFVPPPPLPDPPPLPVEEPAYPVPGKGAASLRWGSTATGIAAIAGLATLVVIGAARREGGSLPAPATRSTAAAPAPASLAPEPAPAAGSPVAAAVEKPPAEPFAGNQVTTASPHAAPAAPAGAARRVTDVRWEALPGGGTRVIVALDGTLGAERWRASRIGGDSPRLVVRLIGVESVASGAPWEPATGELRRIRAGNHAGEGGNELHLVLDLATAAVRLAAGEAAGGVLRLDLEAAP